MVLHQPEIHARFSLVYIGWSDFSYAAFAEEYSYEAGIVLLRPVLDREHERISIMYRWIAELEEAIHRYLKRATNSSLKRQYLLITLD